MLLSKEIAVYLNLVACKLKQYTSTVLRQSNIGLTPEQFLVIDILWNQGPMSQQKIADSIRKDKNSVTKLVNALEKKNLVRREQDIRDHRSKIITLTKKAEGMKLDAKEKGISMLDNMLEGISEDELRSVLDTLNKMTANMAASAVQKKSE